MKRTITLRLEKDVYDFISEISVIKGFHHPLSKDLPNFSKTINSVIKEYVVEKNIITDKKI